MEDPNPPLGPYVFTIGDSPFVIDILLIGYLLEDTEMITNYRYISLIPFSLLFLPRVFIATDFVTFTENIFQKKYIINYIKSYMLFFFFASVISCFLLVILKSDSIYFRS